MVTNWHNWLFSSFCFNDKMSKESLRLLLFKTPVICTADGFLKHSQFISLNVVCLLNVYLVLVNSVKYSIYIFFIYYILRSYINYKQSKLKYSLNSRFNCWKTFFYHIQFLYVISYSKFLRSRHPFLTLSLNILPSTERRYISPRMETYEKMITRRGRPYIMNMPKNT